MASQGKRRDTDVVKLMMSNFKVDLVEDQLCEFYVEFPGPKDSPYENGYWKLHVELPEMYPYKSPSIGFTNKIYHPNVDEKAGSICLDVINQTWSPIFDLVNIFETFLPQLLLYPNPSDPLNSEAAVLMIKDFEAYKKKVKDYVIKYAINDKSVRPDKNNINKDVKQNVAKLQDGKQNQDTQQDKEMQDLDDEEFDEDEQYSGGFLTDDEED